MSKNKLNLDEIKLERAHRMEKGKDDRKRTVIIKFLSGKDKLDILKNAKKLKGTGYYINEDFSKETMTTRKELWDEVKHLRLLFLKYDRIYEREKRKGFDNIYFVLQIRMKNEYVKSNKR